jgi:hypothetical protein
VIAVNEDHARANPPDAVPQVIASYAAYLQAKAHGAPAVTMAGDRAEIRVQVGSKSLVLALRCRRGEWALHGSELRWGEHRAGDDSRPDIRSRRSTAAAMTTSLNAQAACCADVSKMSEIWAGVGDRPGVAFPWIHVLVLGPG